MKSTWKQSLAATVQAVLATQGESGPMMHLMAYAFNPSLDAIYFASRSGTRKVVNLLNIPRASMLWDNRTGDMLDHIEGFSLLAEGITQRFTDEESHSIETLLSSRNPSLQNLLTLEDCYCFQLTVSQYSLTMGYRETFQWLPGQ